LALYLVLAAEPQPARRRPERALCEPVHLVYIRKADLQASAREFRLAMNSNSQLSRATALARTLRRRAIAGLSKTPAANDGGSPLTPEPALL